MHGPGVASGLALVAMSLMVLACSGKTVVPLGPEPGECVNVVGSSSSASLVEADCSDATFRVDDIQFATDEVPAVASDICDPGLDLLTAWVTEDPTGIEGRTTVHYCLVRLR